MTLLTDEEHAYLVNDLGFKKVGSRCPVCYTEKLINDKLGKIECTKCGLALSKNIEVKK
jgi:hypothetical protein